MGYSHFVAIFVEGGERHYYDMTISSHLIVIAQFQIAS